MRNIFFSTLIITVAIGCKKEKIRQDFVEETIIDTSPHVDTLSNSYMDPDSGWREEDIYSADDESYLLESAGEFRIRFDSIMQHYKWDCKLSRGISTKKEDYTIITMLVEQDIKIVLRQERKWNRITKVILLSELIDDAHEKQVLKILKGMILATLNSNFDAEDAELILHRTNLLNTFPPKPGVLQLDGHRYESHIFDRTLYFGIRT